MSFSAKVKEEIVQNLPTADCCLHAMAYGMLLFGRKFNSDGVSLMTEHAPVADQYRNFLVDLCSVEPQKKISPAGKFTVSVDAKDIKAVLTAFSVSGNESFSRINRANLLNESAAENGMDCCSYAFFKGAFLSCGTISDPNKSYHLEFVVPYRTLSFDLLKMLSECGIKAKHMLRRGVNVIYVKDSESIEDLLNYMGATMCAFEIMNIKIYKNFRNVSNRRTNFDEANTSRLAKAACTQLDAIRTLRESHQFAALPQELRTMADAREQNPDASLSELGALFSPPLSRSAVNHRLQKLVALSRVEGNHQPGGTEHGNPDPSQ